jgi:superfamily II DNA helicase RecQ
MLFVSAETLHQSRACLPYINTNACAVFIDEVQQVLKEREFRPSLRSLGSVIGTFTPPVIMLSGTLSKAEENTLINMTTHMGLGKQVYVVRATNTVRRDIKFELKRAGSKDKAMLLACVEAKKLAAAVTNPVGGKENVVIIYCQTVSDARNLYTRYFHSQFWGNLRLALYNGQAGREGKDNTHRQVESGQINVLVATSAFATGLHLRHVFHVIVLGVTGNIGQLIQLVSRASRSFPGRGTALLVSWDDCVKEISKWLNRCQMNKADMLAMTDELRCMWQYAERVLDNTRGNTCLMDRESINCHYCEQFTDKDNRKAESIADQYQVFGQPHYRQQQQQQLQLRHANGQSNVLQRDPLGGLQLAPTASPTKQLEHAQMLDCFLSKTESTLGTMGNCFDCMLIEWFGRRGGQQQQQQQQRSGIQQDAGNGTKKRTRGNSNLGEVARCKAPFGPNEHRHNKTHGQCFLCVTTCCNRDYCPLRSLRNASITERCQVCLMPATVLGMIMSEPEEGSYRQVRAQMCSGGDKACPCGMQNLYVPCLAAALRYQREVVEGKRVTPEEIERLLYECLTVSPTAPGGEFTLVSNWLTVRKHELENRR